MSYKIGQHKFNLGIWKSAVQSAEVSESYQQEIDASLRQAQKAWKAAERAALRVERQTQAQPTVTNIALRNKARALVLARLDELRQVEELMRGVRTSSRRSVRIVNKGGML